MKRVAFYVVSSQLGGAERSLLELVTELRRNPGAVDPHVILPLAEGPLVESLRQAGVSHEVVPMPGAMLKTSRSRPWLSSLLILAGLIQFPIYFWRLRQTLRSRQAALVHTTGVKCHLIGYAVARSLGLPTLWHIRDLFVSGGTRRILRFFGGFKNLHVVANSTASREALDIHVRAGAVDEVFYNGLSPDQYFPAPNAKISAELGLDPRLPLIGILGVLARWKGQLEFVHMAKILRDLGSTAHFVIVGGQIYDTAGDAGYVDELRAEIERQGLADRVHLLGFRKDTTTCLNNLSVLVHASNRPEPFGRVALEAMACGVPVVASSGGGILEFVENEVSGLTYPLGDPEAMAQAVRRLLQDARLREDLVDHARTRFLRDFTLHRQARSFEKIVEKVLI